MIEIGQPAPAFTLPDQDGKQVRLQDLAGRWVVLYFYPRDDTPGCTVEACEFTAGIKAFEGLSAKVYGCSADSPASHQKFVAKYKLRVQLLSDADKKVMKAYGAYGEKVLYGKKTVGVIRSTVVIAPDGLVARHWAKVKAAGHAEAVHQELLRLQGGAAPAAKPRAGKKVASKPAKKAKKVASKPAKKPTKKASKAVRGR